MVNYRWVGSNGFGWKSIIDGDGKGYYAYLDEIFIKHNFANQTPDYEQIISVKGRGVIKYYSGTALLISPFFLAAYGISAVAGWPIDGYAPLFQKTISFAGIIYLLLGFLFCAKLLLQLKIKPQHIILTLLLFLFGTNLLTYTILHPVMSHVYSFFAISLFLWLFNSFIISQKAKYLLWCGVVLALIYLIRPFNILIVGFLWFFVSDRKQALALFQNHYKTWIKAAGLFILIIGLQNILWFMQCGSFFIRPYNHEGFYFTHPEFFRFLFGFRKGLFLYTPLLGISLLGLLLIWGQNKVRIFVASGFLLFIAYLLSAWWCWSYSDGFGMRPFIDFYIVFIILFAILLQHVKAWLKWALVALCLLPLSLNLLQNYQYQKGFF